MSKLSTHELDREIQRLLMVKIREAAQRYKAEPAESGSSALEEYIAALECLAQHIEARCGIQRLPRTMVLPTHRLHAKQPLLETARSRTGTRVIPFPAVNGASPVTAA